MASLIVQFDCNNAESWAKEFQEHLVHWKTVPSAVQAETHGDEIWLTYPDVTADKVKRVTEEARSFCLDRGLSLLEGTGEGEAPQGARLMIADLAKVME